MDKSLDKLKERIKELEAENQRLKTGSNSMTMFAGTVFHPAETPATMTVAGIEEMVILIGKLDNSIGYINSTMAKLLDIGDRKTIIGAELYQVDAIPQAQGVLSTLVNMAKESESAVSIEPELNDFPVERLPLQAGERPAGPIILRFTAFQAGEKIQIIVQEITKLRWLEKTFSRYVPHQVIEKLQFVTDKNLMQPERRTVTIVFADLRGFTAMSEKLEPEQAARIVSSFLGEMVKAVEELEGTIDKFVGDEIMAIFGAPQVQGDHALRALIAAHRMRELHSAWQQSQIDKNEPAPELGIGIATGDVVVGNIGTEMRSDYTAIGHTVNLAARLCGKAPACCIYTIAETYESASTVYKNYHGPTPVPRFSFDVVGEIPFKNVSKPVKVISVTVKK